eukprot:85391-Rhodomonas_salina.2
MFGTERGSWYYQAPSLLAPDLATVHAVPTDAVEGHRLPLTRVAVFGVAKQTRQTQGTADEEGVARLRLSEGTYQLVGQLKGHIRTLSMPFQVEMRPFRHRVQPLYLKRHRVYTFSLSPKNLCTPHVRCLVLRARAVSGTERARAGTGRLARGASGTERARAQSGTERARGVSRDQ